MLFWHCADETHASGKSEQSSAGCISEKQKETTKTTRIRYVSVQIFVIISQQFQKNNVDNS
jgi:hypothetical protein